MPRTIVFVMVVCLAGGSCAAAFCAGSGIRGRHPVSQAAEPRVRFCLPSTLSASRASLAGRQEDSTSGPARVAIALRIGLLVPGPSVPALEPGWSAGFGMNIPPGRGWSAQVELNYWHAPAKNPLTAESVGEFEVAVLAARKFGCGAIGFLPAAGPGLAVSRREFGNPEFGSATTTTLLSFTVSFSVLLESSQQHALSLELRKHWAASPSPGGGESYSPWLIRLGTVLQF